MSSRARGKTILGNEVTGIGKDGLWLIYEGREYYVPFEDYPVFGDATVEQIYSMTVSAPGHLRWKSLDCDIEIEALERPDDFPLIFKP